MSEQQTTEPPGAAAETPKDGPVSIPQEVAGRERQEAGQRWGHAGVWWAGGLGLVAAVASLIVIMWGPGDRGVFVGAVCYGVCICAAWIDAAMRRVPNTLTYPAILLGLGLNCLAVPALEMAGLTTAVAWIGSPGAGQAGWGFLLCAGFGILSFMARGLGGGDVKLLAAVGALIGISAVIPVFFNTLVIAALAGVANWALRGELFARVQVVALGFLQFAATRRGFRRVYPFQPREAPFCVSLLLGLISAEFFPISEVLIRILRP